MSSMFWCLFNEDIPKIVLIIGSKISRGVVKEIIDEDAIGKKFVIETCVLLQSLS